jgi:RNA polymerase sigma-70 factor (ECF subfamily)
MTNEADPFRALYEANHRRVRQLLGRMVGVEDADDLTQTVFAKAAKAMADFRGDAQPSTWLYRIAVNVAADWLRGRSAHEAKLTVPLPRPTDGMTSGADPGATLADERPSPEQELARREMADCIRGEIARLSESHRAVLMLGELGGLTDDDIAQTLGITRGNVKVRRHRARAELRKAIGARCDFYRVELSCAPSAPTCCSPATNPDGGH